MTPDEDISALVSEEVVAAGDSAEQREAEEFLLLALCKKLDLPAPLCKKRFDLPGGRRLEVDGYCDSPSILCEAWAHIGPAKSAQKNKVMADALKLIYASQQESKTNRLILVFADEQSARFFRGRSWMAGVLQAYGIETEVVELTADQKAKILSAQKRQYR